MMQPGAGRGGGSISFGSRVYERDALFVCRWNYGVRGLQGKPLESLSSVEKGYDRDTYGDASSVEDVTLGEDLVGLLVLYFLNFISCHRINFDIHNN
jgi:hypothetical protein